MHGIAATPTQAVLVFAVPDLAACFVDIYADEAMTAPVHDANASLFPGAQNCTRPGSIAEGNRITFVAGQRRAQKGADGLFYSRALQAYRKHFYRIRSGSQVLLGSFETNNIPLGKLYGEPFPFDRDAPGHYGWPSMQWNEASREYIDPLTGVLVKRMTSPGMAGPEVSRAADGVAAFDIDGGWNGAANGAAIDSIAATYSGLERRPLFIRAPQVCPQGWGCGRVGNWETLYRSIDDIEVTIKAWCASQGCQTNDNRQRDIEVCLTVNGATCATAWKNLTVGDSPAASPALHPSGFPHPLFAAWRGAVGEGALPRPLMGTYEGAVNVSGRDVTLVSGNRFPATAWTAGSRIRIGGIEYPIASVSSGSRLTLTAPAGNLTTAPYAANNFGVLLRKATAGAGLLEVDGVSFRWASSQEFEMPASGAWDFCSPTPVQDPGGKQGYLCRVRSAEQHPTLWFVAPSDGEARFLGIVNPPYNADISGGPLDSNQGDCFRGFSINPANPNQVYCVATSIATPPQGLLIFRGTYHPEGLPGCAQPSGYQAIPRGESCHFTWELITKPSRNQTILEQARAFDPSFDPARYPYLGLFAEQGGKLGFYAWAGQDTLAWSIWIDTATFQVAAMQNYHANFPCRFCAVHSFLPLGDEENNAVVVKDFVGGASTNAGPYEVKVLEVGGSQDGSLAESAAEACPAGVSGTTLALGATGVRCITVKISGDPCDPTPSDWERLNAKPCSWQPGAVTLQPAAEGDEAQSGTERFLFVKDLGDGRWILKRHHDIIHGPTLKENTSRRAAHPSGWKLTMVCSAATGSGYVWANFNTDANGRSLIRDNSLSRAQHGDISALGTVMGDYDVEANRLGRFIWSRPVPERRNTAADFKILNGNTFGGIPVHDTQVFLNYIQTHPSWRQVSAPDGERDWYLDGNPFAPQAGSVYTLWRQPASLVTGSLYKLGALPSPLVRKVLPTVAWAGAYQLEDISGPAVRITGNDADNWKYCVAEANEECVTGGRPGDVYLNVPGMTLDGLCGDSFYYRRPCFTSMVNGGIGINQYGTKDRGLSHPDRFLTAQFQRYNFTWTYSNAAPLPDGSWAITSGSWLEATRNDLLLFKIPPQPAVDGIDRGNFVPVPVSVPAMAGARLARLRFGYAENGASTSYFCTSRRESCSTGGAPFRWVTETQQLTACEQGCTISIPGISGRVVYYVADWFNDSGSLIRSGTPGASVVP